MRAGWTPGWLESWLAGWIPGRQKRQSNNLSLCLAELEGAGERLRALVATYEARYGKLPYRRIPGVRQWISKLLTSTH